MPLKWYTKAAESGNSRAMYRLGIMYYSGVGVQRDYNKAAEWLTKGANSGYTLSMNRLGYMHLKGKGIPVDYGVALKWFQEGQRRGSTTSFSYIGIMYANGFGVEQDTEQAIEWYTLSADAGNVFGIIKLAELYEEGEIVEQDDLKALKWYRRASNADYRIDFKKREIILNRVRKKAIMLYQGDDVEKNHPRARELFEESAQWHAKGRMWCALFYATGECDFPKDEEEAKKMAIGSFESIKKEAESNVIESQYLLGMAYYHGLGVNYSWDKAKEYFERAATNDYALAQQALDDLY